MSPPEPASSEASSSESETGNLARRTPRLKLWERWRGLGSQKSERWRLARRLCCGLENIIQYGGQDGCSPDEEESGGRCWLVKPFCSPVSTQFSRLNSYCHVDKQHTPAAYMMCSGVQGWVTHGGSVAVSLGVSRVQSGGPGRVRRGVRQDPALRNRRTVGMIRWNHKRPAQFLQRSQDVLHPLHVRLLLPHLTKNRVRSQLQFPLLAKFNRRALLFATRASLAFKQPKRSASLRVWSSSCSSDFTFKAIKYESVQTHSFSTLFLRASQVFARRETSSAARYRAALGSGAELLGGGSSACGVSGVGCSACGVSGVGCSACGVLGVLSLPCKKRPTHCRSCRL
ncbi:hypothetical protein EYF80_024414 [Liparis tanakae]|uniref:Uncharacterized protein n=1 Tax=Liparis tanakae TaxID=230148 RepID=A0A4Z2HHQ9_9TELE|nr:hypothetical protein EYF80_024414 [Liparis tanakae]